MNVVGVQLNVCRVLLLVGMPKVVALPAQAVQPVVPAAGRLGRPVQRQHPPVPVMGLFQYLEHGRDGCGEFSDAHGPNPDGEEVVVLGGVDVQPANGSKMGLLKLLATQMAV